MPARMADRQAARRKRASGRHSGCDGQETWKTGVKEVLADIRASSPTLRAFRENGARLKESYEALRRALARAQKQNAPQNRYLGHGQQGVPTDISKLLKDVGSKEESKLYAAGALVFGFGLFLAGAAPWLLPACYILFAALCFPWRAYTFAKRKWGFFLLDFCYVSGASVLGCIRYGAHLQRVLLCCMPGHWQVLTLAYSCFAVRQPRHSGLPDLGAPQPADRCHGACAGRWASGRSAHRLAERMGLWLHRALHQVCALLSAPSHWWHEGTQGGTSRVLSTAVARSVLIHLLPGLALFAHRHCTAPEPVVQVWQYLWGAPPAAVAETPVSFFWISGAPLLFYAAWQLMYFVIVQVGSYGRRAASSVCAVTSQCSMSNTPIA